MAVQPAQGTVVEETKTTRVLPDTRAAEPSGSREKLKDIWELVDSLSPQDFLNGDYQFTIYRGRSAQKSDEKVWIGKFQEKLTREEIQRRWGGGEYNVWLKCPPGLQLKYNVDLRIDGPAKASTDPVPVSHNGSSDIAQLVSLMREERQQFIQLLERLGGGTAQSEAVRQALTLNGEVFRAAVPAVTNALNASHSSPSANPMDELTRTFLAAAIQKMLNPADPIEQFAKMMTAMNGLGLNKQAASSATVEIVRGVVGMLPNVAGHFSSVMENYRLAEEAKLKHAAIVRGAPQPALTPPAPAPAPQPATTPNLVVMPPPAAEQPAGQPANGGHPVGTDPEKVLQYIETKMVELLASDQLTAEEAAAKAFEFIDVTDSTLIPEMMKYGEQGLKWAFTNRAILRQIPPGDRVEKFVAEFIRLGTESMKPGA